MSAVDRSIPISAPMFKLKDSEATHMWDDFSFGVDRSKYAEYFDDFFSYNAGDWTVTTTEAGGGDASEAITDAACGVLLITNDNGAADLDQLQLLGEAFKPAAGKKIWFESRFKIGDVSSSNVIVGLAITDTSLVASAPSSGLYFQNGADSALDFVSISTTASSATNIISTADDTWIKAGFKVTGTGLVEYWVNDIYRGAITSNIPTTEMRISLAITNGTTAAETMSVDYIRAVMER